MLRAVLDTNVVVSALIWGGTPFALIRAAADGQIRLFTSAELVGELADVLSRGHIAARLRAMQRTAEEAAALYAALASKVAPASVPRVVPNDSDDDHVIAAALAAAADLIVTGDRHLLELGEHAGIAIVSPADGLRRVAAEIRS